MALADAHSADFTRPVYAFGPDSARRWTTADSTVYNLSPDELRPSISSYPNLKRKTEMPPKNVRTVRQLIYWEYAKLMAGSAVGDRKNYRYVMYCFKKLDAGKLTP